MRLGEGTGALLATGLVEVAAACLSDMATFDEAGVSDREPAHSSGAVSRERVLRLAISFLTVVAGGA